MSDSDLKASTWLYLLVACEHPDADACTGEALDALGHAGLQLVLDGRAAQQDEATLYVLRHCRQLGVTPLQRLLRFHPPLLPPACTHV